MSIIVMELKNQLAGLFDYVTDTALDAALGSNLPFVGNALSGVLTGGMPVLDGLKADLLAKLDAIDALTDPVAIAAALNNLDNSIQANVVGSDIKIHIGASDTFAASTPTFKLDVGSTGLMFDAGGSANVALGYQIDLGVAFNTTTFMLKTDTAVGHEIALTLDAGFDIAAKAMLGFLEVTATDKIPTPELHLDFGLDLASGLVVSELTADDVTAVVNGAADIKLELKTDLSTEYLPTLYMDLVVKYAIQNYDPMAGKSGLGATPTIALENIELDLGSFVDFLAGVFGPIIKDIFGSFPLGPLIDVVTAPVPILDDAIHALQLTGQFDVVASDNVINLLDIAVIAGADADIIDDFALAFGLIKGIVDFNFEDGERPDVKVPLGRLTILGDKPVDMIGGTSLKTVDQNSLGDGSPTFEAAPDPLAAVKTGLMTLLGAPPPPADGFGGIFGGLIEVLDSVGLKINLLSDPGSIVPLILNGFGGGDTVSLIEYDIPTLSYDVRYDQFIPIIGPIGVSFGGGFSTMLDVNFGYDTKGISTGTFTDGFYLTTPKVDGVFLPAATLGVELDAAVAVNVGIAEIAAGGGIGANLSAYLPGNDGTLRFDDLADGCFFDPIAGEVDAFVFVRFSIDFFFFTWSHRFDIADVVLATFEFGCDAPSTEDSAQGLASFDGAQLIFNTGERSGLRTINGMSGAEDKGEIYYVRNANDPDSANSLVVTSFTVDEVHAGSFAPFIINAAMGEGRDVVVIAADVMADSFIEGNDGDDLLVGGSGADHFSGGDDIDHLFGGAGDDILLGGDDDDLIEGGLGADFIDGDGDGSDDGIDQVTYEHSAAGVIFRIDPTNDEQFIGSGGDAEGDTLTNIEYIIASHFDDQIYGNPDENNIIEGLAGNDILIGGDEDDFILGGAGADTIYGGDNGFGDEEGDGTSYLTSAGAVDIDLLGHVGHGGDAEGDRLYGIEHIQGSFADDVISGNGEDNKIDGWYGNDRLYGGGGTDQIRGGEGDDIIFGGNSGGSDLDGGGSIYAKGQDTISYERRSAGGVTVDLSTGDGVDDYAFAVVVAATETDDAVRSKTVSSFENITGSNFGDTLTGDNGYNIITGLNGNDVINGLGGNDIFISGGGADIMHGGKGIDLIDYRGSGGNVIADLSAHKGFLNDAAGDELFEIENIRGSDFADTLTGDLFDNEIDPGLSRFALSDMVHGGFGNDRLIIDYSRGDTGKGLVGGFDPGSASSGSFTRAEAATATPKDGVVFDGIERLDITATSKDDAIFGGAGNDIISTGKGNDLVFTGVGVDRVFAGKGNDVVVSGTDADRNLSLAAGNDLVQLVGGAGIDVLSISLAAYKGNVVLTGGTGVADFNGVNAVLKNGTAISEFEILGAVVTGDGDDKITQAGSFDNFIVTGAGVDEIRSGLGKDYVDGGLDYRIGSEIGQPDPSGALAPLKSIDAIYANDGDLLVLDYSNLSTAVTGGVTETITPFTMLVGNSAAQIRSNAGVYVSGDNQVSFDNIERLDITGSSANDTLTGTNLGLGLNVGTDGHIVASQSLRGDDRLAGGAGDDFLVGGTGDDILLGGTGNDLLLGAAIGSGRGPLIDRGEVDTLTGGAGEDIFVLGTVIGSDRPIVYYNDGANSAVGLDTIGDRTASGSNRAIITDFSSGDRLLLAGVASDYRTAEFGGATHIYLRDGVDKNGDAFARNDELIADLQGVSGFQLDSAAVIYVGESNFVAGRSLATLAAVPGDNSVSLAGAQIASRIAAAAASGDSAARLIAGPAVDTLAEASLMAKAPVQTLGAPSWVTQTADPADLRAALFDSPTGPLSQGKFTIEGDASAFGTFNGDPFGLGHGILLSTGDVSDLAGKNLIDGGLRIAPTLDLKFVNIGTIGLNTIYRADLSNIGFDLNSIKLSDKSGGMGGQGGSASGFDLNALALSHTRLDKVTDGADLNSAGLLPRIDAFAFDAANTVYAPGTQRPPSGPFSNGEFEGSVNGLVDFAKAKLGTFDGDINNGVGYVTLGDGGSLGFNLSQTVATKGPLYLYVAEAGANGEELTTGFTASGDRLNTPTDLSTDLGPLGVEGDSIALTYAFTPYVNKDIPDQSINEVVFDFVFFSEELVEYAQSDFNDNFRITLNGVNLAKLSDGSFASVDTLYTPAANGNAGSSLTMLRTDVIDSDFVYNPVGTGPASGETRADGFSRILHFKGTINPGVENILRIEVNDVRDGLLDSGILIRGGSFTGHSINDFYVDAATGTLIEGQTRDIAFGLHLPVGGYANGPLTVEFDPTDGLDLGAGAGRVVTRTLLADGTLADHITAKALIDAKTGEHFELVTVKVTGADAPAFGIAPLVFELDDGRVAVSRSIGDAPARYSRTAPNAWADAWTETGVHITHTADAGMRVPVYSAVDFGTANPGQLSGSDMLAGDLGVSGQTKGAPGLPQDIAGAEGLRFVFDSGDVSAFEIDFARFERGDSARIELRGSDGNVLQTLTTSAASFALDRLTGVAEIRVGAASGAFVIDRIDFTEQVDPGLARLFAGTSSLHDMPGLFLPPIHMDHGMQMPLVIA